MLRNNVYYQIKPFVPLFLRAAVRRRLALRLRERVRDTWPIMPGSEQPPEGWRGWPEGKKFAVVLTHDVEGKVGLEKCRPLMHLEKELGFRSSFNFIPEGGYRVPPELREELAANGFEVGVHDLKHDGRLFRSAAGFQKNAARINDYIRDWNVAGFRSGFMLRNLDWLHQLEIDYDMSTFDTDPFEPQPEGHQTIFPFWVPRPSFLPARLSRSVPRTGYVELPYTLPQDSTLFLLLRETTADIWKSKVDWIAAHGGMVLLDSHPDYMAFERTRRKTTEYPVKLYEQFLTELRSKYEGQYWTALPREVARHVLQSHVPAARARSNSAESSEKKRRLRGRHSAVLLFSHYPADPRPRRAAEALAAEGVTLDLFCLRDGQGEAARERYGNTSVFRVPLQRHRAGQISYFAQYGAFLLSCFLHLTLRSFKRRYDFVHVHNMPDILVFAALVPKLLGAKVILDLHDPMPELMQTIFKLPEESFQVRMLKRLEKWSIRFADLVLTVNLACKKIYSSRGCPAEKIEVVLNSPDNNIFRPRAIESNHRNGATPTLAFDILYHGSLVRRNGFDLAVDALEAVRRNIPSAKLTVCGESTPYFERVMESARTRGLEKSISYLGVRNLEQIVEAINHCDLGIIPNHRNIFTEINTPTRIFEYLALGKPVIAPKAQGIQDYFGERDLLFFELGDARDLAQKIEFAFAHPDEALEAVRRGQEIYRAHTWSQEKETLLLAISSLL